MNGIFEVFVLGSIAILVVYLNNVSGRLRGLEHGLRAVLHDLVPSERVRALAADPRNRIEAIRLLRSETGVDVRVAMALVRSLAGGRP